MDLKGNLNLAKLQNVGVATIRGIQCVVIPISDNDIYVQKNNDGVGFKHLSIGCNIWEKREADQYGNTHYMQQNLSKNHRDAHPDKKVYLGDLKPFESSATNAPSKLTQADAPVYDVNDNDDLPF